MAKTEAKRKSPKDHQRQRYDLLEEHGGKTGESACRHLAKGENHELLEDVCEKEAKSSQAVYTRLSNTTSPSILPKQVWATMSKSQGRKRSGDS